jgi:hypothetical protein
MSNITITESVTTLVVQEESAILLKVLQPTASINISTPGMVIDERKERRHDFSLPHDYLGVAIIGSAESLPVWKITRLTINAAGQVTATGVAVNVSWTNRYSVVYI